MPVTSVEDRLWGFAIPPKHELLAEGCSAGVAMPSTNNHHVPVRHHAQGKETEDEHGYDFGRASHTDMLPDWLRLA
jgi:hypothetical protein